MDYALVLETRDRSRRDRLSVLSAVVLGRHAPFVCGPVERDADRRANKGAYRLPHSIPDHRTDGHADTLHTAHWNAEQEPHRVC